MRKHISFFILLICTSSLWAVQKIDNRVQPFNQDWRFTLADSTLNASTPAFDDSRWRKLNLPHDWSIEAVFFGQKSCYSRWWRFTRWTGLVSQNLYGRIKRVKTSGFLSILTECIATAKCGSTERR